MSRRQYFQILFPFFLGAGFVISGTVSALLPASFVTQSPTTTPTPRVATQEELLTAQTEWELSAHADTFDSGMGANTTCARCKSPMNWDPSQDMAAQAALDCGSCKRIPGAPRPELESGVSVVQDDWTIAVTDWETDYGFRLPRANSGEAFPGECVSANALSSGVLTLAKFSIRFQGASYSGSVRSTNEPYRMR